MPHNSPLCEIQNLEPHNMLNGNQICEQLSRKIEAGELSNDEMVQIIEHVGAYLNLKTISDYATFHGISYNGAKRFRTVRKIFNVKFVIDNE